MASEGAVRLGKKIREERARRWKRRADFAEACGYRVRVIAALENAERENFSPDTIAAVESVLGWEPGSAERVKADRRIRRREDALFVRLRDLWPDLSVDARRMLVELAERAAGG